MTAALGSGSAALLDAVIARLISEDEQGPGALAAGIPRSIEGALERWDDIAEALQQAVQINMKSDIFRSRRSQTRGMG